MAYAANYRRVGGAVLAIVATGAMFYFGNGLNPWWLLMWIALLPVLVFGSVRLALPQRQTQMLEGKATETDGVLQSLADQTPK